MFGLTLETTDTVYAAADFNVSDRLTPIHRVLRLGVRCRVQNH